MGKCEARECRTIKGERHIGGGAEARGGAKGKALHGITCKEDGAAHARRLGGEICKRRWQRVQGGRRDGSGVGSLQWK